MEKVDYTIPALHSSAEKVHMWGYYVRKLEKDTWIVQGRNEQKQAGFHATNTMRQTA